MDDSKDTCHGMLTVILRREKDVEQEEEEAVPLKHSENFARNPLLWLSDICRLKASCPTRLSHPSTLPSPMFKKKEERMTVKRIQRGSGKGKGADQALSDRLAPHLAPYFAMPLPHSGVAAQSIACEA